MSKEVYYRTELTRNTIELAVEALSLLKEKHQCSDTTTKRRITFAQNALKRVLLSTNAFTYRTASADSVTVEKEPVLKQDNMVLDWRELYGHLLRDSSREVLALYLGVSQAYLKAIEDDWAVPSVKVQTRMVQFETAKTKTTTREVLKRFHLETSKNANR